MRGRDSTVGARSRRWQSNGSSRVSRSLATTALLIFAACSSDRSAPDKQAEVQGQDSAGGHAEELAAERQRQADRNRGSGGGDSSHPDDLVGSWRSGSTDGHAELHVEGGGGNYRAVIAGRTRVGDGPLETARATVRNLTNNHSGWTTHGYEGEVDCEEWFGDRPHMSKGWQWIRLTLYHKDYSDEPQELELSWGCNFIDPPNMTKR